MKHPGNLPLLEPWDRLVRRRPDAPAVIEAATSRTWSFREIDRLGWDRARQLESQCDRLAGLPILFREANGGEWMARFLAALRVNAPALPLDFSTPAEAVRDTASSCGAAEWTADGELRVSTCLTRFRRPAIALLKLTSGTTGRPKPIPFRAVELVADGWQVMRGMGFGAKNRNFAIVPFGHSYGLGNLVVPLLLEGVAVVCGSSPLPHVLAAEFGNGKADTLPAVPSVFDALVRAGAKLPTLRLAITAGAPLKSELARAFFDRFGKPLHNFFGSSETGGIAYDADGEAGLTGRSVGRALPGVKIALTRGGRIAVASAAVYTRGNRRRSNGNGVATVTDFGEWNGLGELVLKGRAGAMIKVGARRLDPAEIERALLQIDGVREAWATGWSSGGEERPAAVVASDCRPVELRDRLRRRLANWKIPRPLVVVKEIPITARGKPDRTELLRRLRLADERHVEA